MSYQTSEKYKCNKLGDITTINLTRIGDINGIVIKFGCKSQEVCGIGTAYASGHGQTFNHDLCPRYQELQSRK